MCQHVHVPFAFFFADNKAFIFNLWVLKSYKQYNEQCLYPSKFAFLQQFIKNVFMIDYVYLPTGCARGQWHWGHTTNSSHHRPSLAVLLLNFHQNVS